LNTIITIVRDGRNEGVVFPRDFDFVKVNDEGEYMIPGYTSESESLLINQAGDLLDVEEGVEMGVWYGSHFLEKDIGLSTGQNGHCIDVDITYF